MSDIVDRARRNAKVIYIAVEESVADEISGVFVDCADEIDRLRAALATAQAERDELKAAILDTGGWDERCRKAEAERDELKRCGCIAIDAGEHMIATLTAERDAARQARRVLRVVEWGGGDWCPCCGMMRRDGHRDGCALAAVLAQEEPS